MTDIKTAEMEAAARSLASVCCKHVPETGIDSRGWFVECEQCCTRTQGLSDGNVILRALILRALSQKDSKAPTPGKSGKYCVAAADGAWQHGPYDTLREAMGVAKNTDAGVFHAQTVSVTGCLPDLDSILEGMDDALQEKGCCIEDRVFGMLTKNAKEAKEELRKWGKRWITQELSWFVGDPVDQEPSLEAVAARLYRTAGDVLQIIGALAEDEEARIWFDAEVSRCRAQHDEEPR